MSATTNNFTFDEEDMSFDGQNLPPNFTYPALEWVSSPELQTFIIFMYSLTSFLSLLGNVVVVVVLLMGKRSSKGIRHFLINLAISDIVMAIFCIPFTFSGYVFGRWLFPTPLCPVVMFMQQTSVTVSVYTLTAIGVDRYMAIMYPLQFCWTKSIWPVLVVLGSIWLLAISLYSIIFVYGYALPFSWGNDTYYECKEHFEDFEQVYTLLSFLLTFAFPLSILAFTYSSIAWKMWKHTSPGNADADRDHLQLLAKTKVIKMLSLVVILFAVCWFPLQLYTMLMSWRQDLFMSLGEYLNTGLFLSCHWLAMANSFVNPMVYCFMNDNFWSDLRLILRQCTQALNFRRKQKQSLGRGRCVGSFRSTTYVLSFRTTSGSTQGGGVCLKKMNVEKPVTAANMEESYT